MNIFLLSASTDPQIHFYEQAVYHCDKHVIKMIAESTQLIVTGLAANPHLLVHIDAALLLEPTPSNFPCMPLSSGHAKHPCAIWAAQRASHIFYLARLGLALCEEKRKRWPLNPPHQYEAWLRSLGDSFTASGFLTSTLPTHFPVAIQDKSRQSTNTPHAEAVKIYRRYYAETKSDMATWKSPRNVPAWFEAELKSIQHDALHR